MDKGAKILLIASAPLKRDGLTKVEMDIIRFNKDLFNIEAACSFGFDNEFGRELDKMGILCHTLPKKRSVLKYMCAVKRLVKSGKYDTVYIHGNSAVMIVEALPAKIGGAARLITHCHSTKSKYPMVHYIARPLLNKITDIKIGCSSYAAKWAYGGGKSEIVLNGVDLDRFAYNADMRDKKRKELGWENNLIIGHIGRFTYEKNHKKIIEVFDEILKAEPSARLLLIGEGELEEDIKSDAKKRGISGYICFFGTTNEPESYYQAMDLLLIPSLHEGLCIAAIEGQANGLPVVLSESFPPETYAAESCYKIELDKSASYWADKILNDIPMQRKDNTAELKRAELDISAMMNKIQRLLLR